MLAQVHIHAPEICGDGDELTGFAMRYLTGKS